MTVEYLNPDKNFDENINELDRLISETKEELENYPEIVYPGEHEFYRIRLQYYEFIRGMIIDALDNWSGGGI